MTTTATREKAFVVLGTTDEVTTCGLCGREDLKGTVVLEYLEPDGSPSGDVVYYGSDCGARAAGWTQARIKREARSADREAARLAREAQQQERTERTQAERVRLYAWLAVDRGVRVENDDDVWAVATREGATFHRLLKEFRAAASQAS